MPDIGVILIDVKPSFPAKIKESVSNLETLQRIETEVWNISRIVNWNKSKRVCL